jgi:hypothetical protein
LQDWEVDVLPFIIAIRGSLDKEVWKARLGRLGLTTISAEKLMLALVKQALTELTEIYSIRQAALFNRQA